MFGNMFCRWLLASQRAPTSWFLRQCFFMKKWLQKWLDMVSPTLCWSDLQLDRQAHRHERVPHAAPVDPYSKRSDMNNHLEKKTKKNNASYGTETSFYWQLFIKESLFYSKQHRVLPCFLRYDHLSEVKIFHVKGWKSRFKNFKNWNLRYLPSFCQKSIQVFRNSNHEFVLTCCLQKPESQFGYASVLYKMQKTFKIPVNSCVFRCSSFSWNHRCQELPHLSISPSQRDVSSTPCVRPRRQEWQPAHFPGEVSKQNGSWTLISEWEIWRFSVLEKIGLTCSEDVPRKLWSKLVNCLKSVRHSPKRLRWCLVFHVTHSMLRPSLCNFYLPISFPNCRQ